MPKIYDDDGNELELDVDQVLAQNKTLEEQLKKNQEEIEKLRSKDANFANLRTKTKAEQEEFKAQMTAKERLLYDRIDDLESKITARDQATVGKMQAERLKQYSNGDEELEKKIMANFERLGANPLSAEEVDQSLEEAFALTQAQLSRTQSVNPVNRFTPSSGGQSPWGVKKQNHADTSDGQALGKELGLNLNPQK